MTKGILWDYSVFPLSIVSQEYAIWLNGKQSLYVLEGVSRSDSWYTCKLTCSQLVKPVLLIFSVVKVIYLGEVQCKKWVIPGAGSTVQMCHFLHVFWIKKRKNPNPDLMYFMLNKIKCKIYKLLYWSLFLLFQLEIKDMH